MKKQTAVSLFVEQLFKKGVDTFRFIPEIEQALEMEKQQIVEAYQSDRFPCSDDDAEQYYKETYEQ
jgi:hypothetical protein